MIRRAVFTLASISILATFVLSSQSPNSSQRNRGVVPHSIENQEALAHFFNALAATRSGRSAPVRIMHFGDSHVAADVLTREIRVRLQQDFGYGGAGLVVPHNPMSTKRRDIDIGASAGWVVEGIGGHYSADSIYGPAGIDIATSQAGERAWIVADSDHFELLVGRSPNAGKIDITIDGASAVSEPVSLSSQLQGITSLAFDTSSGTMHRLEVTTLTTNKVRLFGLVAERRNGVSYDVFGINGAVASRILSWNQAAFITGVQIRKPDLIVVAYGTNELTQRDWTIERYVSQLREPFQLLHRAAPEASILVYGPPDRADVPVTERLASVIEAQRRLAISNNAAFWSSYAAMGGRRSMKRWFSQGLAQPDRVHLTDTGYARLAQLFYDDLQRALKLRPR